MLPRIVPPFVRIPEKSVIGQQTELSVDQSLDIHPEIHRFQRLPCCYKAPFTTPLIAAFSA